MIDISIQFLNLVVVPALISLFLLVIMSFKKLYLNYLTGSQWHDLRSDHTKTNYNNLNCVSILIKLLIPRAASRRVEGAESFPKKNG